MAWRFCRERHGQAKKIFCAPTTSGITALKGELARRTLSPWCASQDGKINGGMPKEFKLEEHGLNQAESGHTRGRGVRRPSTTTLSRFGSLLGPHHPAATLTAPSMAAKLKILGYRRQRIPGNWKLMQENIKDPYHPGLLHTWFSTFGLWRADNKSELKHGRTLSPRRHDFHAW